MTLLLALHPLPHSIFASLRHFVAFISMPWYCQYCGHQAIRSAPFGRKDCPGCRRYSHWKKEKPDEETIKANSLWLDKQQKHLELPEMEEREVAYKLTPMSANCRRQQSIQFLTQRNEARHQLAFVEASLKNTEMQLKDTQARLGLALQSPKDVDCIGGKVTTTGLGDGFSAHWLGQSVGLTVIRQPADLDAADRQQQMLQVC